jgi:hypothetical protein
MSKYQLNTIQQVMGFNAEQATELLNLMDSTNDHPDWSEASNKELRNHFNMVLAGF